jgi:hypothetical protein
MSGFIMTMSYLFFGGILGPRFNKGKEYTVADGFLLRRAVC